jgi:hypothetical protein
MTPLGIASIGVCAAGMSHWKEAQVLLQSDAPQLGDSLPPPAPACLPPVERRRANAAARLAISAASQAIDGMLPEAAARMPTVFSSSDGDGEVLASMLAALAQPHVVLSPTLFHNSVFNAPAGYWSIGSQSRAASITVSAGEASFVAGLKEARGQVRATGAAVLYVAYDAPFPAALASFARSALPFAVALRLVPGDDAHVTDFGCIEESPLDAASMESDAAPLPELRRRFSGNAAADALPLLLAIANRRQGRLAFPYLDGARLWFDYRT